MFLIHIRTATVIREVNDWQMCQDEFADAFVENVTTTRYNATIELGLFAPELHGNSLIVPSPMEHTNNADLQQLAMAMRKTALNYSHQKNCVWLLTRSCLT